jgi:outer membrane lipoprotein LolB
VTRWALTGRLGIQTDTQSLSGNLNWQHHPDFDVIVLATPLGQGVARIERRPGEVVLEIPNQPPRRASDAETLMQDALGYALPLAGLASWVQARPDPRWPADVTRDAAGRVERIVQDGWTVEYLQYADNRPRRLSLTRDKLELRLVMDTWQSE